MKAMKLQTGTMLLIAFMSFIAFTLLAGWADAETRLNRTPLCQCVSGCPGGNCASNYVHAGVYGAFDYGYFDSQTNLLVFTNAGVCLTVPTNAAFSQAWHRQIPWKGKGPATGDLYRADCSQTNYWRVIETCGGNSYTNSTYHGTNSPGWQYLGDLGTIADPAAEVYRIGYFCNAPNGSTAIIEGTYGAVVGEITAAYDGAKWSYVWFKYNDAKWAVSFAGGGGIVPPNSPTVTISNIDVTPIYGFTNCVSDPYCMSCMDRFCVGDIGDPENLQCCDQVITGYTTNTTAYSYRWEFKRE